MNDKTPNILNERRREHNRDLLRRMRNRDSLNTDESRASWFPPRPMIQKDPDAIHRLYSTDESTGGVPGTPQASGAQETGVKGKGLSVKRGVPGVAS